MFTPQLAPGSPAHTTLLAEPSNYAFVLPLVDGVPYQEARALAPPPKINWKVAGALIEADHTLPARASRPAPVLAIWLGCVCIQLTIHGTDAHNAPKATIIEAMGQLAVGIDLGQSYGTAVARLPNGTFVHLAKIRGSEKYISLIQRLVGNLPTDTFQNDKYRLLHMAGYLWRMLQRTAGIAPTIEAAVLADMVAALRVAASAALESGRCEGWDDRVLQEKSIRVAAPYVPAWADGVTFDSAINDALVLAGLQPVTYESSDPVYLVEPSAVAEKGG
ncbi:hypothetical protein Sste5346_008032 [Sporothrix stenoceras]|uniref:Uncharacterized protein n=1 Tax=Sporothrix stenoceras TaxID=5173 RepID=A0ABR3YSL2_9PEZI